MKKLFVLGLVLCISFALSLFRTPTTVHSAGGEQVIYLPGNTYKVCQITGELDRDRNFYDYTANRTKTNVGIDGTDLGYPFEHRAKNPTGGDSHQVIFLFGDTVGMHPINLDSIAYSEDLNPDDCIKLDFVTEPDNANLYHPPQVTGYPPGVPEIRHDTLGIPSHGFSANKCPDGSEKMYVFFSSFSDEMTKNPLRSLLSYSCDRGQSFQYLYDFSSQYFINGSSVKVSSTEIPGLPSSSGQGLLLWGSGEYRKSDVYLAFVPLDQVEDRAAWRYFRNPAMPGQNAWVQEESLATPVLKTARSPQNPTTSCVGELSVTWNPFLHKWLLLYNCNALDGFSQIRFHVADLPWGPWSDFIPSGPGDSTTILFEPARDKAYRIFMHEANFNDGLDDNMFYPNPSTRFDVWGDPYGPYVISRYTTGDARSTTIYYLMSTWNPYQVMLMKSTLRLQRPPVANAGPDQTVSADARCMAQVTLDGRGSSDPDDDPLTYTWTGLFGTATGPTPTVTLPLGTSIITLTVDDGLGGKASDEVVITVYDTTPPTVRVQLSPDTLWPPNHKLVPITATVEVSDNCDPNPAVQLTSITSNEPDNGLGDGDSANDIQEADMGTDDRAFLLRAERSGTGTGRIYTVIYRAEDSSGNGTTVSQQVTVPHN